MRCQNNLKQIGVSLHNYESGRGMLPTSLNATPKPPYDGSVPSVVQVPNYFYSWSVLAELNPYLEQTNIYNSMNLDLPTFTLPTTLITSANRFAVGQIVPLFLCPADKMLSVGGGFGVSELGPTNYCANTGSGTTGGGEPYGSPWDADGLFRAGDPIRFVEVRDGLSNTAAMSESILGDGIANAPSTPAPGNPQKNYANTGPPLTPSACDTPNGFNSPLLRGYMWANGEIRSASYNHFYTPNQDKYDCVTNMPSSGPSGRELYTAVGFKAARSNHPGGVNVLFGDGSVRSISNSIQPATWTAIGTRAGGETLNTP
jgi:prepilin-type processing-associated H-X9-DG protein